MIYILWRKESYGEPAYIVAVFTSKANLVNYRDKLIGKMRGLYNENDFEIDSWEADPPK